MKNLNQKTVTYLSNLIANNQLEHEVIEDLRELIACSGQTQTVTQPASTDMYLKPREQTLAISATDGKWNRKAQEKIFTYGVDNGIENWDCVGDKDQPTPAVGAQAFDLVKSGTYMQFIPDAETSFFQNITQGLQVFKDYPNLIEEILKHDRRVMIPFISQNKKDANGEPIRFVADAYEYYSKVGLDVRKFAYGRVWRPKRGFVIILPQQATK